MKEWFANLQPRERLILLGAALLLLPLMIYLLLWEPLDKEVQTLRNSVSAGQKQIVWLQQASAEVRTLKAGGAATTTNTSVSLISAVETTATQRNLRGNLKRIEPQGSDKIAIDIDNAAFDDIIRWIGELQTRYGASVSQFSASRGDEPGRIEGRLVLTRK